jgi:hypothetical protein
MSRRGTLSVIAVIVVIALITWLFKPGTKAQSARARTTANHPFRNGVVELTFRSRTITLGEEMLSSTGRRTEYIDAANRRRREDYEIDITTMRQLHSIQRRTLIFDGRNLYIVREENGKRGGTVTDLGEGFDYHVWEDAPIQMIEELMQSGAIGEEQFLGRQCKVYTLSSKDAGTYKWWVWNGVTLRSESHSGETASTLIETSEEAVRVEEDGEIDSGLFSPPTDVTFTPVKETTSEREAHHTSTPWQRMDPKGKP